MAAHLIFEGRTESGLDIVRTCLDRYDGVKRNPYNEYECGSWYARALSSYSLLQALTGVRYDAVTKTLYIDSKVGDDFKSFFSAAGFYGTVGLAGDKPFVRTVSGDLDVRTCIVDGRRMKIRKS